MLASNLSAADRTALALRLRRARIDFTLGADSVSVPSGQISQARRLLDSSPGFSGGTEDFSIFDRLTMGQSDFDEQVNYQRSLQGEIERTLMDLHGIDNARVMLAMENSSAFGLAPAEPARASVMLTISPGAIVDGTMARAIAHLVAGSVRGLSAENVTITGNDGVILYPPQREGELSEAMRLRNDIERRLQAKVASLLTRIMGPDRYAVEVAADVDTSRISSEDSLYGKGDQAILSEEHSLTPATAMVGGIPGLTSNLPKPSPSPSPVATRKPGASGPPEASQSLAPMSSRSVINYKPSSREIKTVTAPVRIKQITVAAVLDGTYEGGQFRPLPDERLRAIKELLAAAVGAQLARGDSVEVQSAALSQHYEPPVLLNPMTQLRGWLNDPVHMSIAGGAALLIFVLIIWIGKRAFSVVARSRARARTVDLEEVSRVESLTGEIAPPALPAPTPEPPGTTFETIRTQLNQEVERDPVAAAEVLRKWLSYSN